MSAAGIPVGWVSFAAALAVFAVFVLATMETGLRGDPRTANPLYTGATQTSPWAPMALSALQPLALFGVVFWLSGKSRPLYR